MARARNIKPGFFRNEDLADLDIATRLLFIGMWTEADRAGRLEDRPRRLKMAIFPADNVDVDAMLDGLERFGFIRRYTAGGKQLIQVVNWAKHQSPHHTEKRSALPAEQSEAATDAEPLDNGENTVNPQDEDGGLAANMPEPEAFPDADEASEDLDAIQQTFGPFLMTLEWEPDQKQLVMLAKCAGLPIELFTHEAVGGFKVHHSASGISKTANQWQAALVNWVKRDHVRDARVVQMPTRRLPADAVDFNTHGWLGEAN